MARRLEAVDDGAYQRAIAAEIRAIMARDRIQQKQIADHYGWDRNYLGKRISGQVGFSVPDLTKVLDYLDVDMSDLVGRAKRIARENEARRRQAG